MGSLELSAEAQEAVAAVGQADIVVGIPSYNNARTIGRVVQAVHAGLAKYFPHFGSVIINSDGGSRDATREVALSSQIADARLLLLTTPLKPVHKLSLPYHGIPGKGSAFRMIFGMAAALDAKACAVVDSDLRSITPEWVDLLVRPVLYTGYDFVAPYYHRHKYDGTITNSIVYPLTRALYGRKLRQPIGGDFGMSQPMLRRYLARDDWESDVARYGIDIWMSTIALAEGFRVCQSFLGAKLHDAKDPGADLSAMLEQVAGSVFALMQEYRGVWRARQVTEEVDLFGFRYDVGLDPIEVAVGRMLAAFQRGCDDLGEVWRLALREDTLKAVQALREPSLDEQKFHLPDELWVRLVYEIAAACRARPVERRHILQSLTPLYLGRVASFVVETRAMAAVEVEEKIEQLCLCFEAAKPYLEELWANGAPARPAPEREADAREEATAGKEV